MGLIRKTLMVGTAGIVKGSSKKQRVAKASLKELKQQTKLMAEQDRQAQLDREATMAGRAVTGGHEQRKAELERIRAAAGDATGVEASMRRWKAMNEPAPAPAPAPVVLPPEGWYPHPDRQDLLRWWDGANWTERTAPRVD